MCSPTISLKPGSKRRNLEYVIIGAVTFTIAFMFTLYFVIQSGLIWYGAIVIPSIVSASSIFIAKQLPPLGRHVRFAAILGFVLGLVPGYLALRRYGLPWWSVPLIAAMVSLIAARITYNPPDVSRRRVVIGAVGLTAAIWTIWSLRGRDQPAEFKLALAMAAAVFAGLVMRMLFIGYANSQPDQLQSRIPVDKNHVNERKVNAARASVDVSTRDPDAPSIRFRVITDWQFNRLLTRWALPGSLALFFMWGAVDFAFYRLIIEVLSAGYRPWMVVLIITCGAAALYFMDTQSGKKLSKVNFAVWGMIFGFWGLVGFTGWYLIREFFEKDTPRPWLISAGVCFVWMTWRYAKWKTGYIAVNNLEIFTGTALPYPIPNFRRRMPLNKITTCDGFETVIGNVQNYGTIDMDTSGQRDRFWHRLRFVKFYKDVEQAVNAGS